jgi:hypothetical protein
MKSRFTSSFFNHLLHNKSLKGWVLKYTLFWGLDLTLNFLFSERKNQVLLIFLSSSQPDAPYLLTAYVANPNIDDLLGSCHNESKDANCPS